MLSFSFDGYIHKEKKLKGFLPRCFIFWYNKVYITLTKTLDIYLPENVYILSNMDSNFKIIIMHISILILRANGSDVRYEDSKHDCT
jgi:hypothetical protein